ncbi:hypothetical protein [Hyphomicrobium sp. ghe19]|uniref:hypothetical protein n=1 Tax=Hyphomicrobium sp. ghe19 TaxID=2682968 RepID=UPI001366D74D|nr:hypothetical protein HYPP_02448 [Hyphomicrobium sp. ghe19]
MTTAPITWDRFGMRVHAEKLKDAMTDVLRNVPYAIAFSYAHKMHVTDVLVSVFTGRYVIRIERASIDTKELRDLLLHGLHERGFRDPVELDLVA